MQQNQNNIRVWSANIKTPLMVPISNLSSQFHNKLILKQRKCSSKYQPRHISKIKQTLFDNQKFKSLIEEEKKCNNQKKKIRTKLLQLLKKNIVLSQQTFDSLNKKFNSRNIQSAQYRQRYTSSIFHIRPFPDFFSKSNTVKNYEDYYTTPDDLLTKNFNEQEIQIIINNPKYFFLDRKPLNELMKFDIQYSLLERLNEEEEKRKRKVREVNNIKSYYPNHQREKSLSTLNSNKTQRKSTSAHNKIRREFRLSKKGIDNKKIYSLFTLNKESDNVKLLNSKSRNKKILMEKINNKDYIYSSFIYDNVFNEYEKAKELYHKIKMEKIKEKKEDFLKMKNMHYQVIEEDRREKYVLREMIEGIKDIYIAKRVHSLIKNNNTNNIKENENINK